MIKTILYCLVFCLTGLIPITASAEPSRFHNGLSLQGYTGILNTPNAFVTDEGWLNTLYTNQEESAWRKKAPFQDNYLFSIGFFNWLEIGGRLFESPGVGRDLSGNIKVTSAPLTRDNPLLPVLAAGMQDPGGGVVFLKTNYLVLSEEIWRLRLSAGYGSGPNRMEGLFGGAEFKVHDWVYLLGEHDTSETNLGARVVLPQFWNVPVSFTATAKTSLDYKPGNFEVAFGLNMPLDFRMKNKADTRPAPSVTSVTQPPSPAPPATPARPAATETAGKGPPSKDLVPLRDRLIKEGFLNVRVGAAGRTLIVEYENIIYNHNELDALGMVAGLASESAPDDIDALRIVIKRRNINMTALTMPLKQLRAFLKGEEGPQNLRDHLAIESNIPEPENATFADGDDNSSFLSTSLILSPGVKTFVGTEVGVFDYLLSLKPEITTSLWAGAAVTARWDLPVSWSRNLEDGKAFRGSRQSPILERLMLFQAMKPASFLMVNLGVGQIYYDRNGMLNEAVITPGNGEHRFRIVQSLNSEGKTRQQSDMLLGSYRYYYSPLDLSLEGTVGKFWAEDRGYSLDMKRYWEDTTVSLYYKSTTGYDQKKWQAVGIQLNIPLTPRKDLRPIAGIQLRGSNEWSYSQETTLKNTNADSGRGSLNYLPPYSLALNPPLSTALGRSFYNRDRLSEVYIKRHLERLSEAWHKYRNDK